MIQTQKKVLYKAFGLNLVSEIELPELILNTNQESDIDVVFEKGNLTEIWDRFGEQGKFIVINNTVLFKIIDTAIFCIQEGKRVIISPLSGFNEDKVRLFLLGSCMGILLMQRKVLPLHGSAIAIDGKAYAFVGESGAGKSTLASVLLKRGYRLLSDDVIAVYLSNNNSPMVAPAYPQQKLWKDSIDVLGMDSHQYRPLFERETKYAVPVKSKFFNETLPLAGVFELVKTENQEMKIHQINNLERFQIVYHHTYRNILIPRLDLINWHFNYSSLLISQIKMFQIQRPSIGFSTDEIVSLILYQIQREAL